MGYRTKNKGLFTPRHPEKYIGNVKNIRFLSSWELHADQFLDNNPNVIQWSSEGIAIKYIKPTDKKIHKYYPDYWVKYCNKHGEFIQEIWEVKPDAQTKPPKTKGRNKKTQLRESVAYAVNIAKWQACQKFCDKYNIKFRIITENELFR
jgi:hypothetical protein